MNTHFGPLLVGRSCKDCSKHLPKCPSCKPDEDCVFTSQSCNECAKGVCQKSESAASASASASSDSDSGPGAGAIAGGVIGGVIGLTLITGAILWFFYYSPRARKRKAYTNDAIAPVDADTDGYFEKDGKRYTAASLSSVNTNNTRSSNVIPIAYIPGVQNRSENVPPMPDVNSTLYGDQFYNNTNSYVRGSQYSDASGFQRSSVATNDYRASTAVIDETMMTAVNVKPNLVSVNNNEDGSKAAGQQNTCTATPIQIGSARQINSARALAHSIRIGKAPVGLQNEEIKEGDEEEEEEEQEGGGSEGKPQRRTEYDVPFVIENPAMASTTTVSSTDNSTNQTTPASGNGNNSNSGSGSIKDNHSSSVKRNKRESMASRITEDLTDDTSSTSTFKSAQSRPASSARNSRQAGGLRRNTTRESTEYVMEDMPEEGLRAVYYQQSEGPGNNGRTSPFDDKYSI